MSQCVTSHGAHFRLGSFKKHFNQHELSRISVLCTSRDPSSALACGACNAVSASELHVRELRHVSPALTVLRLHGTVPGGCG